jgi:predicted phage tail protein
VKTIYLYGSLGKRFGKKWRLSVSNLHEACLAIDANESGFIDYIIQQDQKGKMYHVFRRSPFEMKSVDEAVEFYVNKESEALLYQDDEIHILPDAEGGAVVSSIVAATVSAVSFVAGALVAGLTTAAGWLAGGSLLAKVAISVAIGLVMQAITKPPEPPKRKDPISTKSFLMSGGQTRKQQGIAVPLAYGRLRIGGSGISDWEVAKRKKSKKAELLESYSEKIYLDLLCEGPIEGFCNKNGALLDSDDITEGLYFNNVQVRNTSSKFNEVGSLNWVLNENMDGSGKPRFKTGSDNETGVLEKGISSVVSYQQILVGPSPYGADNNDSSPPHWRNPEDAIANDAKLLSHSVTNPFVSKCIFSFKGEASDSDDQGEVGKLGANHRLRFAILVSHGGKEYNIHESSSGCSFSIESGNGVTSVENGSKTKSYFMLDGIATSAYQFDITVSFDHYLNLESGGDNFVFKIVKLSPEFDPSAKDGVVGGISRARNLQLSHIVDYIDENMQYTNCATVCLKIDSKNINKIPQRAYHIKCKKILLPSNYDPVNRIYNGVWDGLMKGQNNDSVSIHSISDNLKEWSDNPAWVLYDVLYNARYGIGKYGLEESDIDKWQLYKVAKYCDELVETAYPIETKSLFPRRFLTSNVVDEETSPKTLLIKIDPREFKLESYTDLDQRNTLLMTSTEDLSITDEVKSRFIDEFGDGSYMAGKKMAFFVHANSQDLTDEEAQYQAASRDGKTLIEERAIISADPETLTIKVSGVPLSNPITRILSGKISYDSGQNQLTGDSDSNFLGELYVGSVITVDGYEYKVSAITNNLSLTLSESLKSSSTGNESISVNKVVGGCACQINHEIVEPRFTANLILTERREALSIIKQITSIFRSMVAFSGGKVFTIQDSLKNPVMLFNNSNVGGGGFVYSGVNKNKRVTACLVRFNDKNKGFSPQLVFEEDSQGIQKFGYIEKEILGIGITSESQARRMAKWVLMTSQLETESVVFKAGQEAAYLYPGCVFEVSDELRVGHNKSGRILGKSTGKYYSDGDNVYSDNNASVFIDKFLLDEPGMSQVEINISSSNIFNSIKEMQVAAKFEKNEIDQDAIINSIYTEQFTKYLGYLSLNADFVGRQGQKSEIRYLKKIREIDLDLKENRINVFSHQFEDGDVVKFYSSGTLPGGLSSKRVYYVVNKTESSFQLSRQELNIDGSYKNIYFNDYGKDIWGNEGGEHYVYLVSAPGETDRITLESLSRVDIGSVYAIKGVASQSSGYSVDLNPLLTALDISSNSSAGNGWYEDSLLGSVYLDTADYSGWVYSIEWSSWFYIKKLEDSQEVGGWVYNETFGWIFIFIDDAGYTWYWFDELDAAVIFYKYAIWVPSIYQEIPSGASSINLLDFDFEVWVARIFEDKGFWCSLLPIEEYTNRGGDKMIGNIHNDIRDRTFGANVYRDNDVSIESNKVYSVSATNSRQQEPSIRVMLNSGHAVSLIDNPTVTISESGYVDIDKTWDIIYISGNIIELVDSTNASELIGDNESISIVATFTPGPQDEAIRFYERQLFRALTVKEVAPNEYEVAGLEYNSSKFLAIERKDVIRRPNLPIPPQADMEKPEAPKNLTLESLN